MSLSLPGMESMASCRWSTSSSVPSCVSATSIASISPGVLVSRRIALSMPLRIALAKYFFGYGSRAES